MDRRQGKAWWRSKTLWLNVALAAGTVAEANLGMLQSLFGPKAYLGIISFAAAVNAALRFVTSEKIK